jgi:hypothetical protein
MEMDKKIGPMGTGRKDVPVTSGGKVEADSRPAGNGSESPLFYINNEGEYCFGTSCFSMRIKPGAGEVRVVVDRNECGTDAKEIVDALFSEVVKGAPTVYETKSSIKQS